ncbi:Bacterial membrane flanked domain protein [Microbacterium azadirachtae]|uniref:Bacterial membrane flanked domain protein n=1 Tax=Microbacterium azadirachtae TaxID=582680 RepID=A0A0F0KFY7_9MICO|nr:PH domain-containing protein [Microbacterium azadirachtae]KJL19768.1 Bacterial membrane flanked domain protein [Microbacterium azadirachtae]
MTIPEPPQTPGTEATPKTENAGPAFLPPSAHPAPSADTAGAAHTAPSAHTAPAGAPVLDEDTYPALRTPTGRGALALDGAWHQISPKYVVAEVLLRLILLVIIAVGAYAATTLLAQPWPWAWTAAGVIAVAILIELVILPRQARAIGYMLRADDIVFRRGILWQRMIAVPYGRMQLVDITRGPVDRAFGIAKLKLVTAAATTGVEIPGMTEDAAEALRDTLIDVAEMRRTGL